MNSSDLRRIAEALTNTAILRGGTFPPEAKRLYVAKLSQKPIGDVLYALEKLGDMARREYENAIPDSGALLALVDACTAARRNRAEMEKRRALVAWTCPDCGSRTSSFLMPGQSTDRRCQSPYKKISERQRTYDCSLPKGQICGAQLQVMCDERGEVPAP